MNFADLFRSAHVLIWRWRIYFVVSNWMSCFYVNYVYDLLLCFLSNIDTPRNPQLTMASSSTTAIYLTGDDTICSSCCKLLTHPYRCSSRDSENACIICSHCIDKHSALLRADDNDMTGCPICYADGKPTLIPENVFVRMEACNVFVISSEDDIDAHVRGCLACANKMLDDRNEEVDTLYTCMRKRDATVEELELYTDSISEEYYQLLNQEHIKNDRLNQKITAQETIILELRAQADRLLSLHQMQKMETKHLREKLFQSSIAYNKLRRSVFCPVRTSTPGEETALNRVIRPSISKPTTPSLLCAEQLTLLTNATTPLNTRLTTGDYVVVARSVESATNAADEEEEPMHTADGEEEAGSEEEAESEEDDDMTERPLARCLDFNI